MKLQLYRPAGNGPARQRRRKRCELACAQATVAAEDAAACVNSENTANPTNAEEASAKVAAAFAFCGTKR
jgi:hypothetical protein